MNNYLNQNEFSLSSHRHTYSSIRLSLHDYRANSSDHQLEFRMNHLSRFVSSIPMPDAHFSFPFHLLNQNPSLCLPHLLHIFSNLNISHTHSNLLAHKIILLVLNYTIARDSVSIVPLRVVAHIDLIQDFWVDLSFSTVDDQTTTTTRAGGATESGIERLKKRKFVNLGDDELGNCVICHEELCSTNNDKEVIKMYCDHLFHESCIIQWLKKSDSCPLCRSPATKLLKSSTSSC